MELRRPLAGQWIAALGGVALLVSLFLPWYEVDDTPAVTATAWESFSVTDILLFVAALIAVALPVVNSLQRTPAIPIALDALTVLVALVAFVFALIRVISPPADELSREFGLWLGFVSVDVVLLGAVFSLRDEGVARGWQPGEESSVATTPLPAPKPDAPESGTH
jgi:hypothetical protein